MEIGKKFKNKSHKPEFLFYRRIVLIFFLIVSLGYFLWSFISVTVEVFHPEYRPKTKQQLQNTDNRTPPSVAKTQ